MPIYEVKCDECGKVSEVICDKYEDLEYLDFLCEFCGAQSCNYSVVPSIMSFDIKGYACKNRYSKQSKDPEKKDYSHHDF